MNVVKIEDFKKEAKKRERVEKVKKFADGVLTTVDEHKEGIAMIAAGALAGQKFLKEVMRNRTTNKRIKEERRHRDLEVYDRSAGCYIQLKRKMTGDELVEYAIRCRNGESKTAILRDMGLIKY